LEVKMLFAAPDLSGQVDFDSALALHVEKE
jgi:hypothetical protein